MSALEPDTFFLCVCSAHCARNLVKRSFPENLQREFFSGLVPTESLCTQDSFWSNCLETNRISDFRNLNFWVISRHYITLYVIETLSSPKKVWFSENLVSENMSWFPQSLSQKKILVSVSENLVSG